ncbi:hypothetical protein C8R31_10312 [Nitrosospira sp. Nsp2]|uniref:hypothetical protein n=1 Tax=Nitrosospira sp. Nsp2 TaxID=136548 RepID=UPI000D4FD389|nr:hypothetical protein [Nitrosospira sp. Nsp2]PTR15429.1 hypothetical protein C8R31_10312 [Nitrosospira sp. Nsp2]
MLFSCLQKVSGWQRELIVSFPGGHWHAIYRKKTLSRWMGEWLGRDQYRWLLSKLKNCRPAEVEVCDVYFENNKSLGLTLTHLARSWAFSFPTFNSLWLSPVIKATEWRLVAGGVATSPCSVMHLANEAHALHWKQDLLDWGKNVAKENTISKLGDYPIQMYPMDHGHPHVHLIDPQFSGPKGSTQTLAKYRVDCFERMEGPPRWDKQMRTWIEAHKEQLLCSWGRCQRGGHPYQIQSGEGEG